jgi:tetratricopeptide (TPR) repeat protein
MARPVSEATDVYGLGGVLYACLTREPPTAPAPALVEAVAATVSGVIVPPSELCPNLDPELERICMRALATDPNQRTRSAAALAKELRDWLAGRHGRSKRTTLGVAAASLATISLVALLALSRLADTPRATPRASTPPPASTPTVAPPPDHLAQARDKHREHAHQDVLDLVRVVLKDDPRNGEALLLRALANHELGAVAAAISDCTDLIELEPNNADAWALRGTLYGLRRQNDKALSDSSRALELDPKHVGAWLEHAAARAMSGDPKGAIEDYSELITFDPDNVRARLRRGAAHFQLGEWPKAIADCDAAIKVGNHPKAYEIRAQARFNLADWQGAEADASHSLKLHDCMSPRVFRGAARIRQGKLEAGIAELQLVIERCLPGDWRVPQAKAFLKEGLAAQQRAAALDQLAR